MHHLSLQKDMSARDHSDEEMKPTDLRKNYDWAGQRIRSGKDRENFSECKNVI